MNFISYAQMAADAQRFSAQLPADIIEVVGVPRSGVLPATVIALHRNIMLRNFESPAVPWSLAYRRKVRSDRAGRVLLIDDTVNVGNTMREALTSFRANWGDPKQKVVTAALYHGDRGPGPADHTYRCVDFPRAFEWNLFHSDNIRHCLCDLDGVLCEDPPFTERSGEDHRWLEHINTVTPKIKPTYAIGAIVTSRLEKWRKATSDWLKKHNVSHGELIMSPYETPEARRAAGDHAARKATHYFHRPSARLFIESSQAQASQIAELTQRPVLCTDTMTFHPSS